MLHSILAISSSLESISASSFACAMLRNFSSKIHQVNLISKSFQNFLIVFGPDTISSFEQITAICHCNDSSSISIQKVSLAEILIKVFLITFIVAQDSLKVVLIFFAFSTETQLNCAKTTDFASLI
jgi:hypothetical protein